MASDSPKCKQWSQGGRWGGSECGKPIKGEWEGTPMCGMHLAGRKRREENAAKQREAADEKASKKSELEGLIRELGCGSVGYSSSFRIQADGSYGAYNHISLSAEDARVLLARLALAEKGVTG